MRRELPDDAYTDVPWCWMSRERWVAHAIVLYDTFYIELRATLRAPSVSRNTWTAWLITESQCADTRTGRDCRPSLAHVQERILRCRRTVQRCRELARLLDVRSVVMRGRHRTLTERLESHKRGDHHRGWTSDAILHTSPSYSWAVDNSTIETILQQGIVTPLPHSGGYLEIPPKKVVTSVQKTEKRRAPRTATNKRGSPGWVSVNPKARLLASKCRSDERLPAWRTRMTVRGLTGVLREYAEHGWTTDDIAEAVRGFEIAGNTVLSKPRNPYGYLKHMLSTTPIDQPPALFDRARTVQLDLEEHARFRTWLAEQRATAIAAADSPVRTAAVAAVRNGIGRRATSYATRDRAAHEETLRELARRQRNE